MDIFDYFAERSGCLIADLKYDPAKRLRYEAVKSVPEDRFPLNSWNELISYLYERQLTFESVEQAKKYLDKEWKM